MGKLSERIGVGQILAWEGGCLFIGHHRTPLPVHAHQAIQLVVGKDADHLVRAGEAEEWLAYSMAAFPSRQPHGIDVTNSEFGAVIFVEPETREGRAIAQQYLSDGIAEIGDPQRAAIAQSIFAAFLDGRSGDVITESQRLVRAIAGSDAPSTITDSRILAAIAYINRNLDRSITLDEVAEHACLSPSRFRHVFSDEVGMGLRPYILWRRFMLTWDLLMKGGTLSRVAHAAGFADAAHLSRTSVRTFGFAPSALQVVAAPPQLQHTISE